MSTIKIASRQEYVDYLVIGAGAAGLQLARMLADSGRVIVLSKSAYTETATSWAQGGIASVFAATDTFEQHAADTIRAGAGLCNKDVVDLVVRSGPSIIKDVTALGAAFTVTESGSHLSHDYHLTREGGHCERRVVHAQDRTGAELVRTLLGAVSSHSDIELRSDQFVVDLIVSDKISPRFSENICYGAYVYDRSTESIYVVRAAKTFLCTGGHGRVYLYTSNPDPATGDGLAIGWRAGCKVANLEFMQFHPTCLYHQTVKNFLVSEAVRGEGAELLTKSGQPFMHRYHPQGSLAPRDIVARAIDHEMKLTGDPFVYLDAARIGATQVKQLFPSIYSKCLELGIDITKEPIPVIPAAHYSCGGLVVDDLGRTRVRNLHAIGEVACTGLHGGNRLASNSLLEALVFADRIARWMRDRPKETLDDVKIPSWHVGRALPADELGILLTAWDETRRIMSNYVGIVRSNARLSLAYKRLTALRREIDEYYWTYEVSERLLEVRNLVQVAWLSVRCAMARKESRGIHYNIDYPEPNDEIYGRDTIIW